jgi:large subunit ribosomal protein L18
MATGPTFRVARRRRRQGLTDYKHRLALLKSRKPRLVVRASNNNTIVQFVEYDESGDRVSGTAQALDLKALGWKDVHTGNLPAAYLAGLLAGRRAKKAGVEEAVLDIGHQTPHAGSQVFAALAGVIEAGVTVPHGEDVLPAEGRLRGEHCSQNVQAAFDEVKKRIDSGGDSE